MQGPNIVTPPLHLRSKVPQAQGAIPSSRQSKLSIWRDDNIANEVRVAFQGALGDAIVGFIPGQLPHDDRLVCGGGKMSSVIYHSLTDVVWDLFGLL